MASRAATWGRSRGKPVSFTAGESSTGEEGTDTEGKAWSGRRAGSTTTDTSISRSTRTSAASAPRWNANVSRTWNRESAGHLGFDSPRRLHVVDCVNMNTRSRALLGIEKNDFAKIFFETSARRALATRAMQGNSDSRFDFAGIRRDPHAMPARVPDSVDTQSLIACGEKRSSECEPLGHRGNAFQHRRRPRREARVILRTVF